MAAREDDIVADEMEDETCDQTGENSAGQVSNSENTFQAVCDFKEIFSIPRHSIVRLSMAEL